MDKTGFEHGHPCDEVTRAVKVCHHKYGKQGEDCVREELSQKKCFAHLLCKREAWKFYEVKSIPQKNVSTKWNTFLHANDDDSRGVKHKVSCATLMEIFAKPENELLIPEEIQKEDRTYCRKITHELATCLSNKRKNTSLF